MVKMIALYRRPADLDQFLVHYERIHLPLVRRMPGLRRIEVNRLFNARSEDADPFLMAQMYFDDRDAMFASIQSPEGRASGRDLEEFAGSLVQICFADIDEEEISDGNNRSL